MLWTFSSVTDGVYSDTSVLNVTINDVNDNVPYFLSPSYSADVAETAGSGKHLVLTWQVGRSVVIPFKQQQWVSCWQDCLTF